METGQETQTQVELMTQVLSTLRSIEAQISLITTFIIKVDPLVEHASVMLNGSPTQKLKAALGRGTKGARS